MSKPKKETTRLQRIGYTVLAGILLTCGALIFLPTTDTTAPARTEQTTGDPVVSAISSVYGRNRASEIDINTVTDTTVTVRFPLSSISAWAARQEVGRFPQVLCALRENDITGHDVFIRGTIEVIDTLGNESVTDGANVLFTAVTADAINCENAALVDTEAIAETYRLHPAMRE